MKLYELPAETKAATGFTHKAIITHEDLTQATDNTAQDVKILTVPAKSVVTSVAMHLTTPFQKTGTSAYNTNTLIIGDSGDTDRWLASTEVNVNGTEILAKAQPSTVPAAYVTATDINANFASMASYDLAELDAGEVEVFFSLVSLADY
jgi:hypothetical protein